MDRSHTHPIRNLVAFGTLALLCMSGMLSLLGCTSGRAATPIHPTWPGVVAADHALAARAGMQMLEQGGNAVDAAVATSLALSVVRPDSCGIGGGGFMLIHLQDDPRHGTLDIAINYRETCPAGIGPDWFEALGDPLASRDGGRAVGVPGTVAGLLHALEKYGTLDRRTVFAPAIDLAMNGWPVDGHHERVTRETDRRFAEHPGYANRFGFVWNDLMHEGRAAKSDVLVNKDQARALRLIEDQGRAAFYEGSIADAIISAVRADGGVMTREDLAGYTVEETRPIRVGLGDSFRGPDGRARTMLVMPPPSSGGIAIAQMFELLDRVGFDMPATGYPSGENLHLLAESMKHAFADRSRHLADPAFVRLPIRDMLADRNLENAASRIDRGATQPIETYGVAPIAAIGTVPEDGGTSHLSVVDRFGNAVACTETINLAFGSMLTPGWYGFCLNNQMDDFTTVRGGINAFGLSQSDQNLPEPGKRPLSSMSPTIVLDGDGKVFAVAGASGGPRIITATAQSLLRALLADATAEEAVNAPRIHHQWQPNLIYFESDYDESAGRGNQTPESSGDPRRARTIVEQFGHSTSTRDVIGASQMIRRTDSPDPRALPYSGSSDPRKNDTPQRHDRIVDPSFM